MAYVRFRRRLRKIYFIFLTSLTSLFIISFITHSKLITQSLSSRQYGDKPRLFCLFMHTQTKHDKFILINNQTWAKSCYDIDIVKQKRFDKEVYGPLSSQHIDLWKNILKKIRQLIGSYESIFHYDSLIIVPAPTFVFREKLQSILKTSEENNRYPLFIIHEQDEGNAYILNGEAVELIRNSEIIDVCLEEKYPGIREKHLWQCVKHSLNRHYNDESCQYKNCFIEYNRHQITPDHIKNGSCLQDNRLTCQSIALLYPVTLNDILTLEFFKYRLKPK